MKDMTFILNLLTAEPVAYLMLLLGAALGAIVGILGTYLMWDRTCKAYEDDADMHIDLALSAIREKNHALRLNAHLTQQNEFLTSMLSGDETITVCDGTPEGKQMSAKELFANSPTDGEGMIIPCSEDFSDLPRDIQFPPQ